MSRYPPGGPEDSPSPAAAGLFRTNPQGPWSMLPRRALVKTMAGIVPLPGGTDCA
jgi:hypothetical protein